MSSNNTTQNSKNTDNDVANTLGFSTNAGVGGGDNDYNASSTSRDQEPAGDFGNFGGGVGDRTQGQGAFGGDDIGQPSVSDQYGSSGGYYAKQPVSESSSGDGKGTGDGTTATGAGTGEALNQAVDSLDSKT